MKKQKVLDNFFQSMQAPGQIKPMIAYGKANFGSGGKGEVSVPTEYVKKVCKRYSGNMCKSYISSKIVRIGSCTEGRKLDRNSANVGNCKPREEKCARRSETSLRYLEACSI